MIRQLNNKIAILSFSHISKDSRVLRQCKLIKENGINPLVIALAADDDEIPYELASWPLLKPDIKHRLSTLVRQLPAWLGTAAAEAGFWAARRNRWALSELRKAKPHFVVANDWPALVVASRWKTESGAAVHYDTHEFATLEFDERLWWRTVYKPFVTHLEKKHIRNADSISTVGTMLARELQLLYTLESMPGVVRNTPDAIALAEDYQTQWPLRVLYHGQVIHDRGIETLIDSMIHWHEPHTVTIRGNGAPDYIAALKQRANRNGHASRVTFEAAVPPERVIHAASATADIGVHFTPLETKQRHFSMPNKLFEYIGAGLAVAVSPGADLKAIVEGHGVGVVSTDASAEAAAAAINELSQASVAAYRKAARQAAKTLCWESEKRVLQEIIEPFFSPPANPVGSDHGTSEKR
jgi:glycogen synthase